MATTYTAPDDLAKKRKEIDEKRKLQAQQCEKERKEKEAERKAFKEKESEWLQSGIDAKKSLNRSLVAKEKEIISRTKGKAMSNCLIYWPKEEGQKAGELDKKAYIAYIKSIQDADDVKYDNITQINSALDNVDREERWSVLKDMIESLI